VFVVHLAYFMYEDVCRPYVAIWHICTETCNAKNGDHEHI